MVTNCGVTGMSDIIKSEKVADLVRRINEVVRLRQAAHCHDIQPELNAREAKLRRCLAAELDAIAVAGA